MPNAPLRTATALAALTALLPLAALAAPKPFTGPASGWDHTVGATATPQTPRAQETWKKSDGEYITYLSDGALAYDDTVAMVKKNITDNGFKTSIDTDRKCDGRRAHEVEMTFGTSVVHQIIVDDAPGVTKVTYTRPTAVAPAADVTTAITAYCGPAS
jgi:hypothetical protein